MFMHQSIDEVVLAALTARPRLHLTADQERAKSLRLRDELKLLQGLAALLKLHIAGGPDACLAYIKRALKAAGLHKREGGERWKGLGDRLSGVLGAR